MPSTSKEAEIKRKRLAEYQRTYRQRRKEKRLQQQQQNEAESNSIAATTHNLNDIITSNATNNTMPTASTSNNAGDLISNYISPNTSMNNIKHFLATHLLRFSTIGSRALSEILHSSTPPNRMIVLAGDFNVNFSLPSARVLNEFLLDHFGLHMINRPNRPTTKGGTTIDAVFCTNPENMELHHLTSYFSYHNPILFFPKL